MSDHRLALRVAALGALKERVRVAEAEAREALWAEMRAGDRQTAHYAGRLLGAVTAAKGRLTPSVSDVHAFTEWVAKVHPTEVLHRPTVRESFKAAVLAATKRAGQPCAPDGTLDVPGIAVTEGEPFLQLRLTAEAEVIVATMVRDGAISSAGDMLFIEGAMS